MKKAMILAAGRGQRMMPLTASLPKPLLKVHEFALIEHHIHNLAKAGITYIVINLHYKANQIVDFLGDGSQYGAQLHYLIEEEILNTGGGVQNALHLLKDENFILLSADLFCDFDFTLLTLAPDKLAHIILVANPDYHSRGDFGLSGDVVINATDNLYTYSNIGIYSPEFFNRAIQPYSLGDLLHERVEQGLVTGAIYEGLWFNVGTPEELKRANLCHQS